MSIVGLPFSLSAGQRYDVTCQAVGSRPVPSITWWVGETRVDHLQTRLKVSDISCLLLSDIPVFVFSDLMMYARIVYSLFFLGDILNSLYFWQGSCYSLKSLKSPGIENTFSSALEKPLKIGKHSKILEYSLNLMQILLFLTFLSKCILQRLKMKD